MAKGTFTHPVKIPLSGIKIPHTDRCIVVRQIAHGNIMPIAYFGETEGEFFNVRSYSYSVQHLPKKLQPAFIRDPQKTAMLGLEIIGVPINR